MAQCPPLKRPSWEPWIAASLIVFSACLMVIFSLGPIFEGPDEIEHYRYIRTVARTRALPDPYGQPRGEYHQAPLYYLINVPLALILPDDDFAAIEARRNPYYGAWIDVPGNDNKNLYLHTRAEAFPYDGSQTALAVHLMRLVSVGLGVLTLVASRAVFGRLWPAHAVRRVLALALVACWPQFLFLSSTINNDNLLISLATITLWLLIRQLQGGLTRRGALALGLVLGALLLTKVSALFISLPVLLALLYALAWDRRAWRGLVIMGGAVLLVAGWWYLHNAVRYHDPAGTRAVLTTWESEVIRPGRLALDIGLERAPFGYETLWARFGQGAVAVASWIYTLFDGLVILTGIGLAVGLMVSLRQRQITRREVQIGSVVVLFAAIWIGVLFYWACTAWSGNQGRYLLPGIAAWAALAGYGLDRLLPRRLAMPGAAIVVITVAAVAVVSLFGYFRPAYRPSPVPDDIARPLSYRYAEAAELIGMAPANPGARPGETITVTLYWRALRPAAPQLQVYLHSAASDVVRRDSLPATGNLLASDWQAGQTWAEHYVVKIPASAPPQTVQPLVAGLYDPIAGHTFEAEDGRGEVVSPVVGRIAIHGPAREGRPDYRFGNVIGLDQPVLTRQDNRLTVCLRWMSLAETAVDYTVFVHLVDDTGQRITQADVQPRGGAYPTGAWGAGEPIDDCVTLDAPGLPRSGWHVALGLYAIDAQGAAVRLPVKDARGARVPDDTVRVDP